MDRAQVLDTLLEKYRNWYDIELTGEEPLAAKCQFHEHGTGFLLIRKAEMWSANTNEYLYIFTGDHLNMQFFDDCLAQARALGEPQIKPDNEHMSSYITALFICDTADDDALKAIKRCRIRKSFHFSLNGWMEIHTAAVAFGGDTIVSNGDGRRTAEFLKNVLHPRKKDLWYKLFKH